MTSRRKGLQTFVPMGTTLIDESAISFSFTVWSDPRMHPGSAGPPRYYVDRRCVGPESSPGRGRKTLAQIVCLIVGSTPCRRRWRLAHDGPDHPRRVEQG